MISRCPLGLPIRYRSEDGGKTIDFTDSAFLTGMLGLFGSTEEKPELYVKGFELIRHPVGDKNDRKVTSARRTSRDQLVAWASQKASCGSVKDVMEHYASKWFINKDILLPHVRYYLFLQAGTKEKDIPRWIRKVGRWLMEKDIKMFCKKQNKLSLKDKHEISQMLCLCNGYGKWALDLFFELYDAPEKKVEDYFCGWRNQEEIYEMYLKWKESL